MVLSLGPGALKAENSQTCRSLAALGFGLRLGPSHEQLPPFQYIPVLLEFVQSVSTVCNQTTMDMMIRWPGQSNLPSPSYLLRQSWWGCSYSEVNKF